jgi:hypothetical protein
MKLLHQKNSLGCFAVSRPIKLALAPGYDPADRGRMNPAVPSGFPCSVHPAGTGRVSDLPVAVAHAAAFAVAVVVQTVAWGSAFRQPCLLLHGEFLSVLGISCKTVRTGTTRKKIIFPRMFDLNVEE